MQIVITTIGQIDRGRWSNYETKELYFPCYFGRLCTLVPNRKLGDFEKFRDDILAMVTVFHTHFSHTIT